MLSCCLLKFTHLIIIGHATESISNNIIELWKFKIFYKDIQIGEN